MTGYILALDQGTTSSRAMVFDHSGRPVSMARQEIRQILPSSGHVEHDPEEIWDSTLRVARDALGKSGVSAEQIQALGVTNQRETTVVWDAESGSTIGNAIVWQSRISREICDRLRARGCEDLFRERTGLLLDPYFSGTKLRWLLDRHPEVRSRASRGQIRFGTIDSFLIWRLTGGRQHVTDVSNASRTLMFSLHDLDWDDELLKILDVPRAMLPSVTDSSGPIATVDAKWLGAEVPISGCAGDQQAAAFGQACFEAGSAKNTYGTGCFLLMNIGPRPRSSTHRLITTVGWRIQGETTYCLEGSVFVGGAVVQWLRDGLGLIDRSADVESLAASVPDSDGVVIVPAFVGLGAPYWDASARGAILGLTRNSTSAHLARAALESLALQTCDLVTAMEEDAGQRLQELKVDGGASVNDLLMQTQSDLLQVPVRRPQVFETTALGAAYLAGLGVGMWSDRTEIAKRWTLDTEYTPNMDDNTRRAMRNRWAKAVQRSLHWESDE